MTPSKTQRKTRSCLRESPKSCTSIDQTDISPKLNILPKLWGTLKKVDYQMRVLSKSPRERITASESNLPFNNAQLTTEQYRVDKDKSARGDDIVSDSDNMKVPSDSSIKCTKMTSNIKGHDCKKLQKIWKNDKSDKSGNVSKKSPELSQSPAEAEDTLTKQIRDIHTETRKSTRIIRDSRVRLTEIQKKENLTEADIKELGERNELLLREMERFDRLTKTIQKLVGDEVLQMKKSKEHCQPTYYIPSDVYDSSMYQEMKMNHPTVLLATRKNKIPGVGASELTRSKSEIDLTRKLSESYDMQEKLVADNADLEVKRYILYKELMTKDQNLETCRSQIKRLQGELKLMNNENALLHEKLNKNSPEGDATAMNQEFSCHQASENFSQENDKIPVKNVEDLLSKLKNYKSSTLELENQLGGLELEVRNIRVEMADVKAAAVSACRGGGARNTCFEQPPGGPPVPPMTRACGVCPPCPAPCNPNAPPTPAEREVQKLTIQLRQTEESLKTKVTECAMLRTDLLKKKEELEKERCQHREVQNKLRELEMKFEGLTTHTNMMMGTKEQAFEQEVNVRALKQCYREAREEIDELRTLMKEQNNQLQDYRVKYLQAQQLVEEQRRQMDLMDMDNTRISEQINLEIQRVKLKFQEKLQELAPIPDLLKATQMKLKDAQQSQAIAEHNAEQLARELNSAREKVHVLLHNSLKPPEKPPERSADEKQMALLQQRISQLTETNLSLKSEIERLKANVIRMEESVLANEKRLHEKMHECAQLGGELDRARDEAARALQRSNERTETLRKCMQTSIGELERQLASTRAQVKTAEKDREELQCRMQCQIKRLNENFEQAQLRILGLQTQVQTLRRTASSTGEGEGDADQLECACKTFFDNP
ncbi:outer dense fiber protein 2-like isoform X1 [Vanessa atalanta]|uniref:outer dense fiber protein 2-like isoform X1 n=2 Tax=Vanessa atalanta TaxID=42275 RepID=UPI001FCD55D4|nr:outer dense fiber protein 2-like isoform X1 [Vanessa atalanta]